MIKWDGILLFLSPEMYLILISDDLLDYLLSCNFANSL